MTRPSTIGHWSLVIATLVIFLAVAPLLRTVSPCTHDGDLHVYRVVAIRHALEEGLLYTRWLPDLAFGYGYPFFNYREPLSYYLALGLYLLGLPLPLALNLVYVLSILGCAVGAYLLARDLFGPTAGLVAAAAYACAPYMFLDALVRGNAPESLALAFLPLILWSFRRLALQGGRRWFAAATLLLTGLYLTHNISALLFTPFLLLYLALLVWSYRRQADWRWAVLALLLALALTAFFWFPALAEKGYAQLHMSRVTRNNDFHYNFLTLAEVFVPPSPVDTSLMNPPMEIHLGLVPAVLAGAGLTLGLLWARRLRGPGTGSAEGAAFRERVGSLVLFAASAVLFVFMSLSASLWLWENLPLLEFVQFPWRFIGRAALPVALLAGACFSDDGPSVARRLAPLALVGLLLAAFPATYPPSGYCPHPARPTVADIHRYERESGLVGVDPEGSYFPVWVEERPTGSPLEEQYISGGTVTRFDETALPEGAALLEAEYGPNRARLVVESPRLFRARYLAFYFPGWRVTVDGEEVPVAPSDPEGLLTFDLPAGRHVVAVRFTETPLRLLADVLSSLSLILFVALIFVSPRPRVAVSPHPHVTLSPLLPLSALLLLLLKLAVVDRVDTPFRRPALRADGTLPGVAQPLNRLYADGLALLGADLSATTLPADGSLRVDLYWTARQSPSRPYQTTVYLLGADGFLWSAQDSARPRGYHRPPPTDTWMPGRWALDSHEVEPLPGTPPGVYRVVVTVFDRETLAPLSVLDEAGQPAAPQLTLGEIAITAPRHPVALPSRGRLDLPLSDLTLLTADFDRERAAPGDAVHLDLLWRAEAGLEAPSADLALRASDETVAASYPLSLPVTTWAAGDVWRSQHRLVLPADLQTGVYTWTVAPSSLPLAVISVTAPTHTYTPPPLQREIGVTLGDVATLLGFDLQPATLQPATLLTVTLVWRAERTPAESYRVFLHLLDPQGRLVAQADGEPAGWTRPTTGWLPGEIITDQRGLTVPADAPVGRYTLSAGLYLPGFPPLSAPDGTTSVLLTSLEVVGR